MEIKDNDTLKKELLDMPIETQIQARNFIRILKTKHMNMLKVKEIKEKEREAFRFYRTGCRINLSHISCIKCENTPKQAVGNCYEVIYKKRKIGYVAQVKDGWLCVENYSDFTNSNKGILADMRKVAVDKFIQRLLND